MKRSILTLCLLGQVLFLWAQNQYYVAPDGNDNHDGSFRNLSKPLNGHNWKLEKLREKQPSICVKVSIGWNAL